MRLIDADKMNPRSICPAKEDDSAYDTLCDFIAEQPTVDAEPIRHAHWIVSSDLPDTLICSLCHHRYDMYKHEEKDLKYCPHCGAKMDEEEK